MKLTVLANNLNSALGIVTKGVAVRPQLPVLANVLLKATKEGLELLATDLEMSFRVKLGAKVEEEGEVGLPAKVFGELLATIPNGAVEIESQGEAIRLTCGKIKAELTALVGGEFPAIPVFKGEGDMVVAAEEMKQVVSKLSLSASKDDSRPVFTGILWRMEKGAVSLVATDGYRLAMDHLKAEKVKSEGEVKLIIPARSLQELMRVVDKTEGEVVMIKVEEDKQQILFKWGEVELVSRLIAGEFPPYQQIIPKAQTTKIEMDRSELLEAVKRAAIFARESANIIKLSLDKDQLMVGANSESIGQSQTQIEVEKEGEDLSVAFNSRYLLDYLGAIGSERVILKSEGSLKPGMFEEAGKQKSSLVQIIMPVRVQV